MPNPEVEFRILGNERFCCVIETKRGFYDVEVDVLRVIQSESGHTGYVGLVDRYLSLAGWGDDSRDFQGARRRFRLCLEAYVDALLENPHRDYFKEYFEDPIKKHGDVVTLVGLP